MKQNLSALLLFGAILLAIFAAFFRSSQDEPAEFVFVNSTEPQTLDPAKMTGQPEGRLAQALFEGLTTYHPKTLEPLPGVAKRWEVSPDGRTYTFHLRQDAYWVRGTERLSRVTAHDFVYSWQRLLNPETASNYGYILFYVKGTEDYKKAESKRYEAFVKKWAEEDSSITSIDSLPKDASKVDSFKQARAQFLEQRQRDFQKTVGLRALDDDRLQVVLRSPTPYFLDITCFYPLFPVNRKCLEEHGLFWTREDKIVTNGPFYLEKWIFNDRIRLRRSPNYWDRDNVGMETIDALAVEELTTALTLYVKKQADWVPQLPLSLIRGIQSQLEDDYHNHASLIVYFYRCNTTREPFKGERGKKVRQALSLAVNRKDLIDNVTKAYEQAAFSVVPPGIPGYSGVPAMAHPEASEAVKKARALLAEAGYPDGKGFPKVTLLYNTSDRHKQIAAAIQNFWKVNLNIHIELTNQEWGTYIDSVHAMNFDMARAGWIGDYTDPNTFLDMWITDGDQNETGWSSPIYDRFIEYAGDIPGTLSDPGRRAEFLKDLPDLKPFVVRYTDERKADERRRLGAHLRLKVLQRADEIVADELPVIPLFFYTTNQLWRPKLEGLYDNLRDTHSPKFFRWKSKAKGSPAGGSK